MHTFSIIISNMIQASKTCNTLTEYITHDKNTLKLPATYSSISNAMVRKDEKKWKLSIDRMYLI